MRAPLWLGLVLCVGTTANAGSAFRFPQPDWVGEIAAETYDEDGRHVGPAQMRIESEGEQIRLAGRSAMREGAGVQFGATLERRGETLALLDQFSESRDEQGRSLGRMTIDHRARVARCGVPAGSDAAPIELPLPNDDRVVNIPLNLLFEPLVDGQQETIEFQLLLCRVAGGRFVDARAWVEPAAPPQTGAVQIRYEVDLGPILARLAAPFMPKLSFWFDPDSPGDWIGHRMPLFTSGPTVTIVRSGFAPQVLPDGPSAEAQ